MMPEQGERRLMLRQLIERLDGFTPPEIFLWTSPNFNSQIENILIITLMYSPYLFTKPKNPDKPLKKSHALKFQSSNRLLLH